MYTGWIVLMLSIGISGTAMDRTSGETEASPALRQPDKEAV
jgi:hypothetical protein